METLLIEKHKIINKKYTENDKDFYSIVAAHNGYEKKVWLYT